VSLDEDELAPHEAVGEGYGQGFSQVLNWLQLDLLRSLFAAFWVIPLYIQLQADSEPAPSSFNQCTESMDRLDSACRVATWIRTKAACQRSITPDHSHCLTAVQYAIRDPREGPKPVLHTRPESRTGHAHKRTDRTYVRPVDVEPGVDSLLLCG
jgi:hypothetical protein